MNKRLLAIAGILVVASLFIGGLFLSKVVDKPDVATDEPGTKTSGISDKTLLRHKITGVENIEGPYKKVMVSDGDITFSFEVPDQWLTDTRNSGEVEMNEEELREYLATNYDGDIKAAQVCNDQSFEYATGEIKTENICSKPYSDYSGYDWETLQAIPYSQLKKDFDDSRKGEFSPHFPNATVTPDSKIWYTDIGWDQVDFYLVSRDEGLRYIENSKKSQKENAELQDEKSRDIYEVKWDSKIISGRESFVETYPKELSNTGEWQITKGGTGGSKYYIDLGDSLLIIWKEAYIEGKFEEGFQHILDTLRFHE